MQELIEYLGTLPPSTASFLGSLTGAGLGLVAGILAVVSGALLNARLNRKRDDRLRRIEIRSLAGALSTELKGFHSSFARNIADIGPHADVAPHAELLIPDHSSDETIYARAKEKILLIEGDLLQKIIYAYVSRTTYYDSLMLLSNGRTDLNQSGRSYFKVSTARSREVTAMTSSLMESLQAAITLLDEMAAAKI